MFRVVQLVATSAGVICFPLELCVFEGWGFTTQSLARPQKRLGSGLSLVLSLIFNGGLMVDGGTASFGRPWLSSFRSPMANLSRQGFQVERFVEPKVKSDSR